MKLLKSLCFFLLPLGLTAQVQISGEVRDAETNQPLPFVMLEIHETGRQFFTDVDGNFSFHIPAGRYHLHLEATGYKADDYDLAAFRDTSLLFELQPTFVELQEVLVEESLFKTLLRRSSLDIERVNLSEGEKGLESSLAETLKKIPGVEAYNTGVGIAKPMLRGFTGTRVAVYDQGIKQEGQQWGMDHGLEIDPFNADRLEIIKGPGALQYGSDAVSGVVKLLPPALPEEGISGNYTGVYKSNNNSLGNSLRLAYRQGDHFVSGRASYQQYQDFRIPADEFIYNGYVLPVTDNRLKNTAGRLSSARITYGVQKESYILRIMGSRYQQKVGLYPGATGIPRAYDVADIGDVGDIGLPNQEITHDKIYAKLNVKLGNNWLSTDVGYQQNYRQENSEPHAHGLVQIPDENTKALGLELHTLSLNSKYNWKGGNIKYSLGTDHQYQQNIKSGWEHLLPDFTNYNGGVFGLLEGEISEQWNWNGGLRLDYGRLQSEPHSQPWYNDPDSLVERSPALSRDFFNYALSYGMTYNPSEHWNLKLNLARSFRLPVPAELVSNGVHHGTFRHETGTPTLDPEEAYQMDWGATYMRKDLYLKFTPFLNYFTNYLYLNPTGRFSPLPEAGQLYQYSQAEALHTGAEIFAEYHPLEALHISTAVEYVSNQNLETNLPLPFTPPLSNLFSVEYEFRENQKSNWSLAAEHRWTAAQERTDRNEPTTPGYQLVNLKARGQVAFEKFTIAAGISALNLFDARYLSHLSRYRILNLPEQGRNLVVNFSVKF